MSRKQEDEIRREWERSVRVSGIDPLVWLVHFGSGLPGQVCCRDCADFVAGLCKGGDDPVRCMRDAVCEVVD